MRLKDKLAGCSHIEGVVRKATSNDPNPPKRESLSEMKAVTCMFFLINDITDENKMVGFEFKNQAI